MNVGPVFADKRGRLVQLHDNASLSGCRETYRIWRQVGINCWEGASKVFWDLAAAEAELRRRAKRNGWTEVTE